MGERDWADELAEVVAGDVFADGYQRSAIDRIADVLREVRGDALKEAREACEEHRRWRLAEAKREKPATQWHARLLGMAAGAGECRDVIQSLAGSRQLDALGTQAPKDPP